MERQHRFEEIADALSAEIRLGRTVDGELLPTERELQERFSASRTTIRRALSKLVSDEWAEAIPSRGVVAKTRRATPKSSRIAYIDHYDSVHKSLFFRLHTILSQNGYELVHVDSLPEGTICALEQACQEGFAAALVWPKVGFVEEELVKRLQTSMPVIAVDHELGDDMTDLVMSDHQQGACDAVSHLLKLGRNRVAISGYFTHHHDSLLRFKGFVQAHHCRDRRAHSSDFVFSSPDWGEYEDPRLLRVRLRESDRPDAIFVTYDMSVPAIVEEVMAAGLRIPEDVAIVGFGNDLPFAVEQAGLTTVGMNWDLFAQTLFSTLAERLAKPELPFRRKLVPTRLIVRGSCGSPVSDWQSDPYEVSSVIVSTRLRPGSDRPGIGVSTGTLRTGGRPLITRIGQGFPSSVTSIGSKTSPVSPDQGVRPIQG